MGRLGGDPGARVIRSNQAVANRTERRVTRSQRFLEAPLEVGHGPASRSQAGTRSDWMTGPAWEAFQRLIPQSRDLRSLGPMKELSAADLRYLTEIDHRDHKACTTASTPVPAACRGCSSAMRISEPSGIEYGSACAGISTRPSGRGRTDLVLHPNLRAILGAQQTPGLDEDEHRCPRAGSRRSLGCNARSERIACRRPITRSGGEASRHRAATRAA